MLIYNTITTWEELKEQMSPDDYLIEMKMEKDGVIWHQGFVVSDAKSKDHKAIREEVEKNTKALALIFSNVVVNHAQEDDQ
jgi:hypothetical protein